MAQEHGENDCNTWVAQESDQTWEVRDGSWVYRGVQDGRIPLRSLRHGLAGGAIISGHLQICTTMIPAVCISWSWPISVVCTS